MGPTATRPVQDPLAVTHLENQLYIYKLREKTFQFGEFHSFQTLANPFCIARDEINGNQYSSFYVN